MVRPTKTRKTHGTLTVFPRPSQVPTKMVFYSIFVVCFIFFGLGGSNSRSENQLQTQFEMVQSFQCMSFQVWNHVKPCETPTAPATIFYGSWLSHTTLLFRYVSMVHEISNIMDVANVPNWDQSPKIKHTCFLYKITMFKQKSTVYRGILRHFPGRKLLNYHHLSVPQLSP